MSMRVDRRYGFTLIVFLLLGVSSVFGQNQWAKIDERVKDETYRRQDVKEITPKLIKGLKSDKEKARAIYVWIAHQVKYDLGMVDDHPDYKDKDELIASVLRRRKGVCQHYAELFKAMCDVAGIKSFVIGGYTIDKDGKVNRLSHAWNGLLINDKYSFVDATWSSGYHNGNKMVHEFRDKYFMIPPKEFITTHVPFDPIFQFLEYPFSNEQIKKENFVSKGDLGFYDFVDSIRVYQSEDKLQQKIKETKRMEKAGIIYPIIRKYYNYALNQIASTRYNEALNKMNRGVDTFNTYVKAKNSRFSNPKLSKDQILGLLNNVELLTGEAEKELDGISTSDSQLKRYIRSTNAQIKGINSKVKQEKNFVMKTYRK